MSNLNVQIKLPLIYDFVLNEALKKMFLLAEDKGICNMVEAAPAAVEALEMASIAISGDAHRETELSKNREFAIQILDKTMNCLDIDEENATKFARIEQAKKMRDSLNEYIAELEK